MAYTQRLPPPKKNGYRKRYPYRKKIVSRKLDTIALNHNYFCHFIVKLRSQFIAKCGNSPQIGINALHHQSGTMHILLRHNEFNPRRAQNDGVESACNFKPIPCHSLFKPYRSVAIPAGQTAVTHTFLYRISLANATENDFV